MADHKKLDYMYMDIAYRVADMSYAERKKVGALLVKDSNILAFGWNGMPSGFDNKCEHIYNAESITNNEVVHAEQNVLAKMAKNTSSSDGATIYVTLSPCMYCAVSMVQSGIKRIVYHEEYRKPESIDFLLKAGVEIERIDGYTKPGS